MVGSGPSGLACAQQLARAGHEVTLYERSDRVGGLLMYGIPDFKLEKRFVNRRVEQMQAEGVNIVTSCRVGFDIHGDEMRAKFDAIVLTMGATKPRDLPIPGRELEGHALRDGVSAAAEPAQCGRHDRPRTISISAKDKRVVILGGGDTGSDCLGTSNRQGAISVSPVELLPMPPERRTVAMPWPDWPMILRTSTSHEEGVMRDWSINTKKFIRPEREAHEAPGDPAQLEESERRAHGDGGNSGQRLHLECDLVLLALGFLGPEPDGIISQLGLKLDPRSNVLCENYSRACRACSRQATRGAGNRWWCGRFGRGASARAPSTRG